MNGLAPKARATKALLLAGLVGLGVTVSCADDSDATDTPSPEHLEQHSALARLSFPLVVGHGGTKHLCAENTLSCYQMALDFGANALEADLQVLGDGTLVMFHDDNTLAQTGVAADLRSLDLAAMRELDMGHAFTPDDGRTFPFRGAGLTVATLEEFLGAFPDVPVLLDVKPEIPEMADALIAFASNRLTPDDRARVYIKSNDPSVATALRAIVPRPLVALSTRERVDLVIALSVGDPVPLSADLAPSWLDLNPNDVPGFEALIVELGAWARAQGHVFTASTIDDPSEMEALLSTGALDGLVTNRPDLQSAIETP